MAVSNEIINILYLEDDFKSCPIDFSSIRQHNRFKLSLAVNCEEARKLIRTTKFDLFILDIEIKTSRESGIQFAEELRMHSLYTSTPIIFVSIHTHYSSTLLTHIKNSSFLPKPIDTAILIEQICLMLNFPKYIKKYYSYESLIIPTASNAYLEIKPNQLSYIEAIGKDIVIQYINGKTIHLPSKYGIFKNITTQIQDRNIDCLRQIHRSIIININQISKIHIEKNIGFVYLFADKDPKPLGVRYRYNLSDYIQEADKNVF